MFFARYLANDLLLQKLWVKNTVGAEFSIFHSHSTIPGTPNSTRRVQPEYGYPRESYLKDLNPVGDPMEIKRGSHWFSS